MRQTSFQTQYITVVLLCCSVAIGLVGCAPAIPNRYLKQAEPGVTLTSLKAKPAAYRGKTVILGGVIVERRQEAGRICLLMKNRPLDADHVPHRDATLVPSESALYWVIVEENSLPPRYREWARVTVVGWVSDAKPPKPDPAHDRSQGGEPVLDGLYLKGWGSGDQGLDIWEDKQDPNYIQSNPLGELRQ
ncbi:MAG: Slp family lipoprotein [Nitrospiraceae bacterium]